VFANVLLVDEINRATPKTQSALLEAMAERNVTVDGVTHPLPQPFLVLATQNPVELAGTFPLPEAQLDRFLCKLNMGYPDLEAERQVMLGNAKSLEVEGLEPVVGTEEVLEMISLASDVEVTTPVQTYILEITQSTRKEPALLLGAGPRASISLLKASKVAAAADGRARVYPEDVKALLRPVLGHRMMLTPDAVLRGDTIDDVLERVVGRIKPPLGVDAAGSTPTAGGTGSTRRRRSAQAAGARSSIRARSVHHHDAPFGRRARGRGGDARDGPHRVGRGGGRARHRRVGPGPLHRGPPALHRQLHARPPARRRLRDRTAAASAAG
jgi:Mg-chelatase subunit ChlI